MGRQGRNRVSYGLLMMSCALGQLCFADAGLAAMAHTFGKLSSNNNTTHSQCAQCTLQHLPRDRRRIWGLHLTTSSADSAVQYSPSMPCTCAETPLCPRCHLPLQYILRVATKPRRAIANVEEVTVPEAWQTDKGCCLHWSTSAKGDKSLKLNLQVHSAGYVSQASKGELPLPTLRLTS